MMIESSLNKKKDTRIFINQASVSCFAMSHFVELNPEWITMLTLINCNIPLCGTNPRMDYHVHSYKFYNQISRISNLNIEFIIQTQVWKISNMHIDTTYFKPKYRVYKTCCRHIFRLHRYLIRRTSNPTKTIEHSRNVAHF